MTSVAMALSGFNIKINGEIPTPRVLNKWLRENDGYVCINGNCNNLVLNSINKISPKVRSLGEPQTPFIETLQSFIVNDGLSLMAHVRNRHHFVLITGVNDENSFLVNDPNYDVKSYEYDEISDLLVYDISE